MSNSNTDTDLDLDNFNFNDDDNDNDSLSLDEIKKKVDSNRKRIYKKKSKPLTQSTSNTIPNSKVSKVSKVSKPLNTNTNTDTDILNQLKELLLNQNQILNNLNSKPIRKQRVKKPVIERKTLDLTITDNDIKNIIDNNNNKNKINAILNPPANCHTNGNANDNAKTIDPKLVEFLKAFQK